jgi:hypothetical protein
VPPESEIRIALASALLFITEFDGGVLWVKEWRVGDIEALRAGWGVLEMMRSGLRQSAPIEVAPGHLFRLDELQRAQAFLSVILLWSWQAFWIPAAFGYFTYLHHNDKAVIHTANAELATTARRQMRGWKVSEDPALDFTGWADVSS